MFQVRMRAQQKEINLRYYPDDSVGVALDETVTEQDLDDLLWVFGGKTTAAQVGNV